MLLSVQTYVRYIAAGTLAFIQFHVELWSNPLELVALSSRTHSKTQYVVTHALIVQTNLSYK